MDVKSARFLFCFFLIVIETDSVLGQSLSRMKKVSMSSFLSKWIASSIVDGYYRRDANTCRCCAATSTARYSDDQWIQIDLGATSTFTRIVVYGANDSNNTNENLIGLSIELDGVSVASIEDKGQGHVNFYNLDLGQRHTARLIRFILKGTKRVLQLCEVDVFNDSQISKEKSIVASSRYADRDASYAVDGFIRTADPNVCRCCASTMPQTHPWFSVDLGDTFLITYIQLYGRTDAEHSGQSFEGMTLEVDDSTIHTVHMSETYINYYELLPTPERIGRHVKLTLNGTNRVFVLCELVVYGERVVSIKKQAQLSSTYSNMTASRAVDGDFRTRPSQCDCCATTMYSTGNWLRIDLGQTYEVSRIVIYGTTEGKYGGFSLEEMTVTIDALLVHTIPESTTFIYFYAFQLVPERLAQTVTLTTKQGYKSQLTVCELLVYGDCVDGFFGKSCSRQCHCEGESCSTVTGICPSGKCKPGYTTKTCSEHCEWGRYGHSCSMSCGHCKDGLTCDHVTGHCDECDPGYTLTFPYCNKACSSGRYGTNCSETCGSCRHGRPCNFVSGHCLECADGYTNTDMVCKTVCSNGTYGTNCSQKCGNCRNNETCHFVDGNCTECMDGYTELDRTCKTRCFPRGIFGRNCSNVCGSCRKQHPCDYRTGLCDGCMDGFRVDDPFCKSRCHPYSYGYNCSETCGHCRDDLTCDPIEGYCNACDDGFNVNDLLCKTACPNGTYGFNCTQRCGLCKGEDVCDKKTGHCPNGCFGSFKGEKCLRNSDNALSSDSILVIAGSSSAVVAVLGACVIALVFYMCHRRNQSDSTTGDEITRPAPQECPVHEDYESINLYLHPIDGDPIYTEIKNG